MSSEFDMGILEEFTKVSKILSKISKDMSSIMKQMTNSTEEAMNTINKTSKKISEDATKTAENAGKISKKTQDQIHAADRKNIQGINRIQLSHSKLLERQFLRTSSRQHGNVMGFMQMVARQSNIFGGASELSELRQIKKSGKVFTKEENIAYNRLTKEGTADKSPLMPLFKKFDEYFGAGSKWDKMFLGHGKMAAGVIGIGAAGLGVGVIQKGMALAIEASPVLQSMLKLWQFGIMMVLRPIGDFFGFVMRPIMIALLQHFIIPWYQTYLPLMQTLGLDIGDRIAKILVAFVKDPISFTEEWWNKLFPTPDEETASDSSDSTSDIEDKPLKLSEKQLEDQASAQKDLALTALGVGGIVAGTAGAAYIFRRAHKFLKNVENIGDVKKIDTKKYTVPKEKLPGDLINKGRITKYSTRIAAMGAGISGITATIGKSITTSVTKALAIISPNLLKGASFVGAKLGSRFIPIVGQVLLASDILGTVMKKFSPETYEGVRQGALGVGKFFGDDKGTTTETILDFLGFGQKSAGEALWELGETVNDGLKKAFGEEIEGDTVADDIKTFKDIIKKMSENDAPIMEEKMREMVDQFTFMRQSSIHASGSIEEIAQNMYTTQITFNQKMQDVVGAIEPIATILSDAVKKIQQELSNKYNITTYTPTGEVSTTPNIPRQVSPVSGYALSSYDGTIQISTKNGVSTVKKAKTKDSIMSSYNAYRVKHGGTAVKYAEGGIIDEPIFGIGVSGKSYLMGESGKEVITPMNKIKSGDVIVNINIGRIEKNADFNQLKPLIQRWILEANSRRGMI